MIIPGAWQGPSAWQSVKANLEASGQKVILIQLAGHDKDTTDPSTITMDVYRDQVVAAINGVSGKVILVGHSLGGMIASAVAEKVPAKIDRLIYVAAYVPVSGQSLLDLAQTDAQSLLGPNISSPTPYTLDVTHNLITNIFIQDGTTAEQSLVLNNYKVEPAIPFTQAVTLTAANYGIVNKFYIHTTLDHAISPDLQNRMVTAAGIKKTYSLTASHSPFLSKPDSLSTLLLNIAK
ncbi:alpha/beta fold hydrolase [Mucilaginibacter sp.]|uniref:alpha/beta fold hydrolase n=1 Tax=Mucilaginibacter sp. TaxID=1882438 RepID=UPI00356AE4D6